MAHVVAAFSFGCSGCEARVIVQVWSCGCVRVIIPGVEELESFGHFKGCTEPRNRVLFSSFERLCVEGKLLDRQKDPPSKHADT